jgi:hypothetical protein
MLDFKTMADWVHVDEPIHDFPGFPLVHRRVGPAERVQSPEVKAVQEIYQSLISTELDPAYFSQYQTVVRNYLNSIKDSHDWVLDLKSLDKPRNRQDTANLIESLLDLTFYHDTRLVRRAFGIIHRLCNGTSDLLTAATKADILVADSSKEFLADLDRQMPVVRRIGLGMVDDDEKK